MSENKGEEIEEVEEEGEEEEEKNEKKEEIQEVKQINGKHGLAEMKWRIDQLTSTKKLSDLSDSVALVSLLKNNSDTITFEVDKKGVEIVLKHLEQIQSEIVNF